MRIPLASQCKSFGKWPIGKKFSFAFLFLIFVGTASKVNAEGSKDFINYPGYRMFLDTREAQQMKVFVTADEFLNIGSSHLGIQNGFIKIYRPDGTLHATLTGNAGDQGIIYNKTQEQAGPNGGGSINGPGYEPWSYKVTAGQEGIWTVYFGYPDYVSTNFPNIMNNADWNRADDQPNTPRVVLAWDVTVTQLKEGNYGGLPVSGRVFTNEYVTVINQNGYTTSPKFHIVTKDGFVFEVQFMDADPFRFPISSNNIGFSQSNLQPIYNSQPRTMVIRSDDPSTWTPGSYYLYEPQAQDYNNGFISNNKIFFNQPDKNLPSTAPTTDIFRNKQHTTWLLNVPNSLTVEINNFHLTAVDAENLPCDPNLMEIGLGANFSFESNVSGTALLSLDISGDGDFDDPTDRIIFQNVNIGSNLIYWDGKDGQGNPIPVADDVSMEYLVKVRGGETHILLTDVENNHGGVTFAMTNNIAGVNADKFYYDHSSIGGDVSGGGTPGNPLPTDIPFTYQNNFGNNRILDSWAFFEYDGEGKGTLVFDVSEDCNPAGPDKDLDGIPDILDIDDDNDGITDANEYCNPANGFACLPGGFDPSTDLDGDGVLNFMDANDPAFFNPCVDTNGDGVCDQIAAIFDTDKDGVADHWDLDSDNDGITDLVEAGHNQPDANGDGVIDGLPAAFGLNGLYNPIASDPDDFNAVETYSRLNADNDGIPDYDDLDSDNDGINDVAEAGYSSADTNNDGRINFTSVNADGLTQLIDPIITGQPIPRPRDNDGDGIPDWHDLDSDNDLIHDVEEGGNPDPDDDAIIGTGTLSVDNNGLAIGSGMAPTSHPLDSDSDLIADFHDLDSDNDGINDVREADGNDPDEDGLPGTGNISVNNKGIPTSVNGVSLTASSHPADTDSDLVRDYRDLDSDNDNINDVAETNKPDSDNDGRVGQGIPFTNASGQSVNIVPTSAPTDTDNDGIPDFREKDSDDDGINDVTEANQPDLDFDGIIGTGTPIVDANGLSVNFLSTSKPTDTDNNGTPDFQQLDSDADGILDEEECPVNSPCRDWDNDNTADFQDSDRDDDGIFDGYECETGFPCPDTDNDGIPDVDDLDTDGDMLTDIEECPNGDPCPDADGNGIPEWREFYCNPNIATPVVDNLTSTGTTFCEGSSVSFNASNSVDVEGDSVMYQWAGPNGFSFMAMASEFGPFPLDIDSMDAQNAGEYFLNIFTEEGCPASPQSIMLEVTDNPETPSLTIKQDILCEGQTLELNSSIVSGNNIQYQWWFNDGNGLVSYGITDQPSFSLDNINLSNVGAYSVTAISGNCSSEQSNTQNVTIDNSLAGVVPILTLDEDFLCEGQSLELSSTSVSGPNIQYQWIFNDGSGNTSIGTTTQPTFTLNNVTNANSGIYSVMVLNANCTTPISNGEVATVSDDLNSFTPTLEIDEDVLCEGQTIELNSTALAGQNVQYQWWFDGGSGAVLIGATSVPTYFIQNASMANTGLYSVTVAVGQCESQFSNVQDITISDIYSGQTPELTVLEDQPCEGTFIELNSTVLSGGNVSYNWYFNDGNGPVLLATTNLPTYFINDVDSSQTGIYTVTASFGNCETQLSNAQDITVTDDLTDQTPILTIDQSTLCEGEMLELNSSTVNGNNVIYEWWFNDGSGAVSLGTTTVPTFFINNVSSDNEGIYEVTYSVGNCTSLFSNSQDVTITIDLIDQTPQLFINQNSLCEGEMLELNSSIVNGGNVTYEWFFNDGASITSLGTTDVPTFFIDNVSNANSGVYTVQASVGNCTSQSSNAQDVVVSNTLGMAPELTLNDDVICEGEMLELNSSMVNGNNVVYHWWFDDGTGSVEIMTTDVPTLFLDSTDTFNSGIYSVSVSVGNCNSQLSNSQDVMVQQMPDLTATNTTDDLNMACPGEVIELQVPMVLGATYQWTGPQGFSSNSINPIIENADAGNAGDYYVMVETDGCSFISEPTTVYIYDDLSAANDDFQIMANDSITTTDLLENDEVGNVEEWSINILEPPLNGTLVENANNELVYLPREGYSGNDVFIYEICNVQCPDQCGEAMVSIRVFLDNEDDGCFVPNIITPNDDGANDFFNVPCLDSEYTNNNLKVFNRWGDMVFQAQPYKNDWSGTYKNVPLPPGTYFYVLQLDLKDEHCKQGYFTITR